MNNRNYDNEGTLWMGDLDYWMNESFIMNLKHDEVMHFLINDILKSDFFSCKNEDNIKNILENIKKFGKIYIFIYESPKKFIS